MDMLTDFNLFYLDLFLQVIVIILLIFAVKKAYTNPYNKHCKFITMAIAVQILSVLIFMVPSMYSLSGIMMTGSFTSLMYLHHILGLIVIVLSMYIKLAFTGKIPSPVPPLKIMKPTLILWILTLVGGFTLYLALWRGVSII
jgi:putative membrane protein